MTLPLHTPTEGLVMRLFWRKSPTAAHTPRGVYIWESGSTLRLLFIGNNPICRSGIDEESTQQLRQLQLELGRALDPSYDPYSSPDIVRIYKDYVALQHLTSDWSGLFDWEAVESGALESIRLFLGWSDVPVLGRIRSSHEFHEIRATYDYRWSLGRLE